MLHLANIRKSNLLGTKGIGCESNFKLHCFQTIWKYTTITWKLYCVSFELSFYLIQILHPKIKATNSWTYQDIACHKTSLNSFPHTICCLNHSLYDTALSTRDDWNVNIYIAKRHSIMRSQGINGCSLWVMCFSKTVKQ